MYRVVALLSGIFAFLLLANNASTAQGFYPREWWRGDSGLFSRDYVTPDERTFGYVTGGGRGNGKIVFAAATVDARCQMEEAPRIAILSPNASRVTITLGDFIATGNDSGSTYCRGRKVRGTIVSYVGKPARGERIDLRVLYPAVSDRPAGRSYDHQVVIGK
jgi:hypothetical protein